MLISREEHTGISARILPSDPLRTVARSPVPQATMPLCGAPEGGLMTGLKTALRFTLLAALCLMIAPMAGAEQPQISKGPMIVAVQACPHCHGNFVDEGTDQPLELPAEWTIASDQPTYTATVVTAKVSFDQYGNALAAEVRTVSGNLVSQRVVDFNTGVTVTAYGEAMGGTVVRQRILVVNLYDDTGAMINRQMAALGIDNRNRVEQATASMPNVTATAEAQRNPIVRRARYVTVR